MATISFSEIAGYYFKRFEHFNAQHGYLPAADPKLRLVVVIPAYAEDLSATLHSLGLNSVLPLSQVAELESSPTRLLQRQKAQFTGVNEHFWRKSNEVGGLYRQTLNSVFEPKACEILLVLNNSADDEEARELHRQQAKKWQGRLLDNGLAVRVVQACQLNPKQAGVGLARKIGMDLALARLAQVNHNGFIVCLDGDCTVSKNYLAQLLNYEENKAINGMSIHFEHDYKLLEEPYRSRIIDYEIWLRYYVEALRYAQYPHAFYTVGSSMLCRAAAYAKIGGMNRRKAGEDFYFLHKLIPQGNFKSAAQPVVYPSARISMRVPFGTGRAMLEQESGRKDFNLLYNPEIFEELKQVHTQLAALCAGKGPPFFQEFLNAFPKIKSSFEALRLRSKSPAAFEAGFYHWWDGFKVLQYVHYRQKYFEDQAAAVACKKLLGLNFSGANLLDHLRALEINQKTNYL